MGTHTGQTQTDPGVGGLDSEFVGWARSLWVLYFMGITIAGPKTADHVL